MTVLYRCDNDSVLNAPPFICCRNIFSDDGSPLPTDPAVQSAVQARDDLFSLSEVVFTSCSLSCQYP